MSQSGNLVQKSLKLGSFQRKSGNREKSGNFDFFKKKIHYSLTNIKIHILSKFHVKRTIFDKFKAYLLF